MNSRARSDALWIKDKNDHGWVLPFKAPWLLRLPVIRHIRAAWHSLGVYYNAERFADLGFGFGQPNPYDLWVIYAIARGWA